MEKRLRIYEKNHLVDERYEVLERLDFGSYAEIWLARDYLAAERKVPAREREVVLKALNTSLQGTPDTDLERTLVENFQNEAIALDTVRHPHVILRLGHGTAADLRGVPFHYLALEYMSGGDLLRLCHRQPGNRLGLDIALYFFKQACEALAYAHSRGVIHCDLKPSHLLLSTDAQTLKIAGFGVAKLLTGGEEDKGVGLYVPPERHYAPPERHADKVSARGKRLTASTDIYSLAKSVYTVLCGRSPSQFIYQTITALPADVQREAWADGLLNVLQRATAVKPEDRYATVIEFWSDLANVALLADAVEEETQVKPRLRLRTFDVPTAPPQPKFTSGPASSGAQPEVEVQEPLNEVKLLLVGHGRVGKTSLSKALRGLAHNAQEPETPGIERHSLLLNAGKDPITAHVWDFGGQEFLHQTHQFFFSERSIYVVVLSGRQGRPIEEAEYWLRLIRTYGKGSPVVIALNQIKAHAFSVDEFFLREKYPEVKKVVQTDCDPPVGITSLGELLSQLAGEMKSVRLKIPPTWVRVRMHLEEMENSFVSFTDYREICAELGVTEEGSQENLATILNSLGIALNYRDDARLRDNSVLKPRWLVDGIYTILRWLQKHETNGEMRLSDFAQALPDAHNYPERMHKFLLALMEKFELCFPVESAEGLYVIPALLNANQPGALIEFTGGGARRIQFRYDGVRPPGLLPRFIVRSHTLSEQQARWLRGVVLARGQARALVRGDHEGHLTDVYVIGDNTDERVWLAEFILAEMRVLNDKLPVRTLVESEAQPGAWTELELLREAAQRHQAERAERRADGQTVMVPVEDTLREVESPEASAPKDHPLPLFICYAHADEQRVKQLLPSLKVLARRGYITPWHDNDLVPGEDWGETIQARLTDAQIILFMVSRQFLASDYITDCERPLAMKLVNAKKAMVLPVLLSNCSWDQEDFAALENLPHKGRLVSSYTRRDDAWRLVEEGIKKAVMQMRKTSLRGG